MNYKNVLPIGGLFCILCSFGGIQAKQNEQTEVQTVNNAEFFRVVTSFLDKGRTVIIPSKGTSMMPIIQDGDALFLEPIKPDEVQRFDVILYEFEPESFFVNRVVNLKGQSVSIMGDSSSKVFKCSKDVVRARAVGFITKDNKAYSLDDQAARGWASDWYDRKGNRAELLESVTQQQVLSKLSEWVLTQTGFSPSGQYESFKKYRKKNDIIMISWDGTAVLIKDENPIDLRKSLTLNGTAMYLWEGVTGKAFNAATLAKLLTDEYEVSYTLAYDDSVNLIKEWLSQGVIEYDMQ